MKTRGEGGHPEPRREPSAGARAPRTSLPSDRSPLELGDRSTPVWHPVMAAPADQCKSFQAFFTLEVE